MKIFCVGRNYAAHAKELGNKIPDEPVIFMKGANALLPNNGTLTYPDFTQQLHYEGELVVKISRRGKLIAAEDAGDYYAEMTVGLDFTARDIQSKLKEKGLPWEKAKAFDGSAAVGDWHPKQKDMTAIDFSLSRNGEMVQDGHTEHMLFPVDTIIAHISRYFTLDVGDLVFTGTPPGVGACRKGDRLEGFLGGEKVLDIRIAE